DRRSHRRGRNPSPRVHRARICLPVSAEAAMTDSDTRARRAHEALRQYVDSIGVAFEESSSHIAGLIADLLHLAAGCDQGDAPIESTLRPARMHFEAGRPEGGGGP